MTNAWIYNAALICDDCASEHPTVDGPYYNGGGEADTPQHCDLCSLFLENPLTSDGDHYVRDAIEDGDGDQNALKTWSAFYDYIEINVPA